MPDEYSKMNIFVIRYSNNSEYSLQTDFELYFFIEECTKLGGTSMIALECRLFLFLSRTSRVVYKSQEHDWMMEYVIDFNLGAGVLFSSSFL